MPNLLFLALHGEGVKILSVERICPDIYHPAIARDGFLTRLRIPGGVLSSEQCLAIADLLESTGLDYVQVTNRANLQLRGLNQDLDQSLLPRLIAVGLVSANPAIDGIRNIMASPTAGIDRAELIDVLPLVAAWEQYLSEHPELGVLSNKFSVGFDGGGSVSILDRPNDLTLFAVSESEFLLHLPLGRRLQVGVDECISMLGRIAQAYLRGGEGSRVRLRDVMEGVEGDLRCSGVYLTQRGTEGTRRGTEEAVCGHLGVWEQKGEKLSCVGVVLALGRWGLDQVRGLGAIACQYGSGTIRLTPWQNAIVSDIRHEDVDQVRELIERLGLRVSANHPSGLLMACAGARGCQFSATETQEDALTISAYLESRVELDQPLNIHLSGCDKSCAQHYPADIALWGCEKTDEQGNGYRLCIGGSQEPFGRELLGYVTPGDARMAIGYLIDNYHKQRASPSESFRTFTNRQSLDQLQQVLHVI